MENCTGKGSICKRCGLYKTKWTLNRSKPNGLNTYCSECMANMSKKFYKDNKILCLKRNAVSKLKNKLALVEAYGGKCNCCGVKEIEFLTLDHIGGGGTYERRVLGIDAISKYRQLAKQGYPKDKYRILCMNCNFATRFGKECPHGKLYS